MRNSLASPLLSLIFALLASGGCAAPAYQPGLRKAPAASAPGVIHREGRLEGAGGVSLFNQEWTPDGAVRATLLIVHGLKDHSDRYAGFAERLARAGYRVRAFDLRGHGDSAGDRVWVDRFDEYLEDLDIEIEKVRGELPNKPVFLMGHSMGGAIVTLAALQGRSPVRGLILSAPALKRGSQVSGFVAGIAGILGSVAPRLAVLDLRDEDFSRDPQVVEGMKRDPLISHGKGPARTGKGLLSAIERIQVGMEKLTIPVLALHGTEDRLTNPDGSRELVSRAASQDKTLKLYPGLFHDLLHEPEHAQVEQDILTWLDARSAHL
jgi:acylglycerol lipase